jgi:hemerythrin-like domain-containing protein
MYLVYYRHHIAAEERDILPLAKKLLNPDDWTAIALARPAARDPLFGDESDAGYRELRRHILMEAETG